MSTDLPTPDAAAPAVLVTEPESPGTSAKLVGGKPLHRYLLWYGLAAVSIFAIWGAIGGIILPNQVQMIEFARWFTGGDAGVNLQQLNDLKAQVAAGTVQATAEQTRLLGILAQFDAARAQSLSSIVAVGVFVTMFVQPIAGVLSDRTRSKFGRRAPWIAGGAVIGAILMIALRYSMTIALVMLFWSVAQLVINVAQGPLTATVADRVVEEKLGWASAISGLGTMLGAVIGAVVAGVLFGTMRLDTYYVYAVALVVLCLVFLWRSPDRSSTDLHIEPMNWAGFFKSFLIPLKDSDYRWVWIAKIAMMFGYSVTTTFGLYMMQSYIHPALSAEQATQLSPLMSLVGLPFMLASMLIAGRWSDRIKRRKPFVFWTSILLAASLLVPLFWPTLPALFIQAIVGGIALGAYLVVDQALFIDVIVDKKTAGRDLGMSALGGNFGQALGPILAGQIVALTAGYAGVWVAAAVIVLIAAVAIVPVKRAQ